MSLFQASQRQRDDIVVGLEYPVGKPVIAHELPYVFVQGSARSALGGKNINVMLPWDLEPAGHQAIRPRSMMSAGSEAPGVTRAEHFIKMPLQWPECCSGAGQGPHRHRARDRWHQRYRPTSCVGPGAPWVGCRVAPTLPGEHGFLADPGLILPPNFYRRCWPGAWRRISPNPAGKFF